MERSAGGRAAKGVIFRSLAGMAKLLSTGVAERVKTRLGRLGHHRCQAASSLEEMADPYVAMDATVYGVDFWLLHREAPQEEADV